MSTTPAPAPAPHPSVLLGPIRHALPWHPSIPVVAAVNWRAPALKPPSQWRTGWLFEELEDLDHTLINISSGFPLTKL